LLSIVSFQLTGLIKATSEHLHENYEHHRHHHHTNIRPQTSKENEDVKKESSQHKTDE
jgi:hypothetical protein